MSLTQRLGAIVVAIFAIAFTRAPGLIRALGPAVRWLLDTGLPAGPNALLTVSGRRTGLPRTVPVSILDLGDRVLLQASSPHDAWVRNLRASGRAIIARGGHAEQLDALELDPDAAGRALQRLLERFPRSRLVRAVVGPSDRPPVGVLHFFRLRVDDRFDDYVALARRQPVFELRRRTTGDAPGG